MKLFKNLLVFFLLCFSLNTISQDITPLKEIPDPYITFWKKNVDSLAKQWIFQQQSFYSDYNKTQPKPISANVLLLYNKIDSSAFIYKHPRTLEILQGFLLNSTKTEMAMSYFNFYAPFFEKILTEKGMPKELKYLPFVLSAMNNRAINQNGAGGIWQMMYSNGLKQGLEIDSYVDDRRNIEKATEAALREITEINQLYSNFPLSLLAYTCGPTNVSKAIRRSDLSRNIYSIFDKLPAPGRDIVFALSATIILFENAESLNLKVPTGNFSFEMDSVEVNNRLHFTQIESVLNIPIENLRYLNPAYKLDIVPAVNEIYKMNLPKGSLEKFSTLKDSIYTYQDSILFNLQRSIVMYHPVVKSIPVAVTDNEPKTKLIYHTIKKGENLHKIATKYDVQDREILKWNNLRSAKSLKVGKRIKIFKEDNSKPSITPKPVVEKQTPIEINPATDSSKNVNFDTKKFITYTAKKGDTYFSISKKFPDVTIEHIYKWNNLNEKSSLREGDKIKIYQKVASNPKVQKQEIPAVNTSNSKTENFTTHIVKTGESLSTIAKKYPGATVEKIMKWNNLSSPDKINLGQKLKIMKP